MLKALIKKQLLETWRGYFYNSKKNVARSKAATILYFILFALLMFGLLGGTFFGMTFFALGSLVTVGLGWMFYLLVGLLALFLGVFGSVFNTFSSLYRAKDNELLLSLPISERDIILSRLINVFLLGVMYSAFVFFPGMIAYFLLAGFRLSTFLCGLLMFVLITALDLLFSCLFGWVVAKIAGKIQNKGLVSALAGVLFMALYYFVYFRAMDVINSIVENAASYAGGLSGAGKLLYSFGRIGSGEASALTMLLFTAGTAALTVLTYLLLKKSFLPIATSPDTVKKQSYTAKPMAQQSVANALLKRELARFLASPTYILNCGLGILVMPVAAIILAIKADGFLTHFYLILDDPGLAAAILGILPAVCVGLVLSMNCISTPSVSLEGKSLWISHSLPITAWDALHAKENLHVLLNSAPAIVSALIIGIALKLEIYMLVLNCVFLWLLIWVTADFGLMLGLWRPNLNWTSETGPIKQSVTVLLAIFSCFLLCVGFAAGAVLLRDKLPPETYFVIGIVVLVLLYRVLHAWLKTRGAAIFENL